MSRPTIDRFIDTLVLVLGIVCRAVLAALVGMWIFGEGAPL
jgi:hypothetical protein